MFPLEDRADNVIAFAEQVRLRVGELKFTVSIPALRVTLSGGFALHNPKEPIGDFIDRVDQALYRAKSQGRNQTVPA